MLEDEFKLYHEKGKLYAVITIKGETYEMDVTDYFENNNPHDDWLDYRLGLRDLAEKSKLTKSIYQIGDKVKIIDAMASDLIGKEAEITKVFQTLPQCYELNIGGGHWLHSTLEKI